MESTSCRHFASQTVEDEFDGFDRVYLPSLVEAGPDFVLGDPAEAESPGLTVAEAQHEVAAAWLDHCTEALDEQTAVVVFKDVEQAAIEHSVELLVERSQLKGVMDQEVRGQAAVASFGVTGRNSPPRNGQLFSD